MAGAIKGITVEIGGNTTKLSKAIKDANSSAKTLQNELKGVNKLLKMDPTNVTLLTQKQEILNRSIEQTKEKLKMLRDAQAQVQAQFDKGEITEEQFRDFQREIVATENKLKSLNKELNKFGTVGAQQIAAVGEKLEKAGTKVEKLGKKFTAVSTVATAGLVAAGKEAIDFETAWTGVTKTVNGTEAELEAIKQGLLDLSQQTGSAVEDIAAVAENAGQLGVATENILSFTEIMVRLGDSTNLSADEASSAIAKLYNVMGGDLATVDQFGSSLVDLGNNMATTEADILNMATRVAASGKQIGLTEQEVLALAATLSSVGLEAEAGGSAISAVMTMIDKDVALGTEGLNTWAEVANMSVSEFKSLWENDAMSAIQAVVGGMGDATAGGENLNFILEDLGVTSLRQTDTMKRLSTASELMGDALNISNQAWEENSALTTESDKRYATTAAKIQQLKNTVTELAVKLGESLLPIINSIVEGLGRFVNWLTNLSPTTQKVILIVTALVASIAPLLIMIGKILFSIGQVMKFAPQIATMLGKIGGAFKALWGVIAAHPVIAIITAIIAIVVLLYNKCEWFRNAVNTALNFLKNLAITVFNALVQFFTVTVPNALNTVVTFFQQLPGKIMAAINNLVTSVVNGFNNLKDRVMAVAQSIYNNLPLGFQLVVHNIQRIIQGMVTIFQNVFNIIKTVVQTAISVIKAVFTGNFSAIPGIVSGAMQKIRNFIANILDAAATVVINMVAIIINYIRGLVTSWVNIFNNLRAKVSAWWNNFKTLFISRATDIINSVVTFFATLPSRIYNAIVGAIARVRAWGASVLAAARSAASNMVNAVVSFATQLPGRIYNAIMGAVSRVVSWGSSMLSAAKSAVTKVVNGIVNTFKTLPSKMVTIGKNVIQGLINGIKSMVSKLYSSIKSALSGLVDKAKDALGINSPSKVFAEVVGKAIPEGIAKGVDDNTDLANKSVDDMAKGLVNGVPEFNDATINRKLTTTFKPDPATVNDNSALLSKLDGIYERLNRLQIVLDTGTLVGETIDKIDRGLATRQLLSARGV